MGLLLAILVELVINEAWASLKGRLSSPSATWASEVAAKLANSDLELTPDETNAVRRWLDRGDVFAVLAQATPDTVETLVERVAAPLEYELGAPPSVERERAEQIAIEVVRELVALIDPTIAATLSTYQALKAGIEALKQGQVVIMDTIESSTHEIVSLLTPASELDSKLASVPPTAATVLRRLHEDGDRSAALLAEWVNDPTLITSRLRELVDHPPAWLEAGDWRLWEALAHSAEAHSLNELASKAYAQAATRSPTEAPRLFAWAALSAHHSVSARESVPEYIRQSRALANDADLLFIDVVEAGIANDAEAVENAVLRALASGTPEPALLRIWVARARIETERFDEALSILEPIDDDDPSITGALLTRATSRLSRATSLAGSNRMNDLREALDLAVRARDKRRLWGGDSGEAVELACQAAFLLDDFERVAKLASHIEGEATKAESTKPTVRRLLALVQTLGHSTLSVTPESAFESAWLRGLEAMVDPARRDEAVEAMSEAARLAEDDPQLDGCLRGLAHLGVTELPRLEEVLARDPERAAALRGLAEFRAGQTQSALERLRPLAMRDPFAAIVLAQLYASIGQTSNAATSLLAAGDRFGDPSLTVEGCKVLLSTGDIAQAEDRALHALDVIPDGVPARRELRRILVDIAATRGNPTEIEQTTRIALAEGESDAAIRWTRIQALGRLRRFSDAWSEIQQNPVLNVDTEPKALLFLGIRARAAPEDTSSALAVLDRFPDSHEVQGVGLALFLALARLTEDEAAQAVIGERLRRFTERYPDSPILRSISLTLDDPESLRAQMKELLSGTPEQADARRELAEGVVAGRIPLGFAAAIVGRSPLDLMLSVSIVPFTCISHDSTVRSAEIAAAVAALDGPITIDPSSLALSTYLSASWNEILASFSHVTIAEDAYGQLDTAVFLPASSGTLHWDEVIGDWHFSQLADEDSAVIQQRATTVLERAGLLSRVPHSDGSLIEEKLGAPAGQAEWAAPIGAALDGGTPLLCDDVGTAAVARSLGVPAFGTLSLQIARMQAGRLTPDGMESLIREFYAIGGVDLPLSPGQLVEVSRSSGWLVEPLLRCLSRSSFWLDLVSGSTAYFEIVQNILDQGIDAAAKLLHASTLGIVRAVLVGSPLPWIARLVMLTIAAGRIDAEDVRTLVSAVRGACAQLGAGDPLEATVRLVYGVADAASGAAEAAQFTSTLFSNLDPEDVIQVTAWIVGGE
jgi:tetratricopeptide (TPR) repeat protein